MLRRAFPTGVAGEHYLAVIQLLHSHYSARNLSLLLAGAFGHDAEEVYASDIGRALAIGLPADTLAAIQSTMYAAGFSDCIPDDAGS